MKFQINLNPLHTFKAPLHRAVFLPFLVNGGLSHFPRMVFILARAACPSSLCQASELPHFRAVGGSPPGLWESVPRPPAPCQHPPVSEGPSAFKIHTTTWYYFPLYRLPAPLLMTDSTKTIFLQSPKPFNCLPETLGLRLVVVWRNKQSTSYWNGSDAGHSSPFF